MSSMISIYSDEKTDKILDRLKELDINISLFVREALSEKYLAMTAQKDVSVSKESIYLHNIYNIKESSIFRSSRAEKIAWLLSLQTKEYIKNALQKRYAAASDKEIDAQILNRLNEGIASPGAQNDAQARK